MLHQSACQSPAPFSFTREQDPKVLKILHLGQDLFPDLKKAIHPFPGESLGLRFGGADFHPGHFALGCELMQRELELTGQWGQQDPINRKKQRPDPEVPKPHPSTTWLRLQFLTTKFMNRIGNKGQSWRSRTLTGNESDLLPALWTKL